MSLVLLLVGCLALDANVFNPVHCTNVGPSTCEEVDDVWNRVCATCEEPYDWTAEHPWFDGQLGEGQTIRPITDVQRVVIASEDGEAELDAYWIPSHGERAERAELTVLYNHGNYRSIEHYRPRVRILHELGFNVLVWDYRGFGKTEPATTPTPEQFMADARQVRQHVETLAPDTDRILAYGYSLGAVPAVEQATAVGACGLVLESPFTSMQLIAASNTALNLPETYLSYGDYDNLRKLDGHPGPVFAMIGTDDNLFPPADVRQLVDVVAGPTRYWELEGASHGIGSIGLPELGIPAYDQQLADFLTEQAPSCL